MTEGLKVCFVAGAILVELGSLAIFVAIALEPVMNLRDRLRGSGRCKQGSNLERAVAVCDYTEATDKRCER